MTKFARIEIDTLLQLLTREIDTLEQRRINAICRQNSDNYEKEKNRLLGIVEKLESWK